MKKFLITIILMVGMFFPTFAQNVTFNIMKTDGTTESYVMSTTSKIYYSDTQLFFESDGQTVSYDLASLRKAYFSEVQNVNEIDNQQLTIYPNPAKDILRITNISDNQEITIYSINGAVVKRVVVSNDTEINVSDLRAGLYIIGVGNEFSKFIKM